MATSKMKGNTQTLILWVLLAVIVVAGIYLRFTDLEADPPLYFDGSGQSLSTDPYQYTFHARNKILFDSWDPLGDEHWKIFETTLVSALSYIIFALFGVSRFNANLTGLILSLLSIFLFLLAVRKFVGFKGILLMTTLLLFNRVLFVYGRLPYLENGVMLWASLIFLVFVNWRERLWGKVLLGVLVALAGLSGKIFGLLLIAPLAAGLWFDDPKARFRTLATVVASAVGAALLWIIVFYGGHLGTIMDYFYAQSLGLYGFPNALKSPLTFVERFVSFGNDAFLYALAPAVGLAGFLALAWIFSVNSKESLPNHRAVFFLLIWFAAGFLAFMFENYRPLRYEYMLYLPLAGIAGYVFDGIFEKKPAAAAKKNYFSVFLIFLLIWVFFEQVGFIIDRDEGFVAAHRKLVWMSLVPALVIAWLNFRYSFARYIGHKFFRNLALSLIPLLALVNFGLGYATWQEQKSFNVREAGNDLGEILGPEAVLTGPMAPTLLLENRLKGLIYAAGISKSDPDLFKKFPVTHFAIDAASTGAVITEFPQLSGAEKVDNYWVRDAGVIVARISRLTGNPQAANYQLTDFEIGRDLAEAKKYDSSLVYLEKFATSHPDNKSVLKLLSLAYAQVGDYEYGLAAIRKDADLYPRDFSLILELASYYMNVYRLSGSEEYRSLAGEAFTRALTINPYQTDNASTLMRKIAASRSEEK